MIKTPTQIPPQGPSFRQARFAHSKAQTHFADKAAPVSRQTVAASRVASRMVFTAAMAFMVACGASSISETREEAPSPSVTITQPTPGQVVGPADDCNPNLAGLQVEVVAEGIAPRSAQFRVDAASVDSGNEGNVPAEESPAIVFGDNDAYNLQTCIDLSSLGERASVQITVTVEDEASDQRVARTVTVSLSPNPLLGVSVASPADGSTITLADDCDIDAEGLQVRVVARVDSAEEDPDAVSAVARFSSDGVEDVELALVDQVAVAGGYTFEGCVDVQTIPDGPVTLTVDSTRGDTTLSGTASLTFDTALPFDVSITSPMDASVLGPDDDCDDGDAGFSVSVEAGIITASADATTVDVVFTRGGDTLAFDDVETTGSELQRSLVGCFDVGALGDGVLSLTVRASDADISESREDTVEITVVTTPPDAIENVSFEANEERRRDGVGTFAWSAGADTLGGDLASYEIRCAADDIVDEDAWGLATLVAEDVPAEPAGNAQSIELEGFIRTGETLFCLVRGRDVAGLMTALPLPAEPDGAVALETVVPFLEQNFVFDSGVDALEARHVAALGDVSGDDVHDFLVGFDVGSATPAPASAGLFLGQSDLSTVQIPDVLFTGISESTSVEYVALVAGLGDINGDGLNDFAIGDPLRGGFTGRLMVFLGRDNWPATVDVSTADCPAEADLCINGVNAVDTVGWSVVSAGDFDGDGTSDFAVAAANANSFAGQVAVILGGAYLFGGEKERDFDELEEDLRGFFITGSANAAFGYALGAVGDVNADAREDLLAVGVGAFGQPGRVFELTGRAYTAGNGFETIDFIEVGVVENAGTTGLFGNRAGPLGDIDGDGRVDFGVFNLDPSAGELIIYLRKSDSFADPSTVVHRITNDVPNAANDLFGKYFGIGYLPFLPGVGTIDHRDNLADIMVSGRNNGVIASDVQVFFGRDSFATTTRTQADFNYAPAPAGGDDERVAALVGDVNADGRPDVLVLDNATVVAGQVRMSLLY